jgi:hypothetical protein
MTEGIEKSIAVLSFEVHAHPRRTLTHLEAEVCRFLNEMKDFYAGREDEEASNFYSTGLIIHATIGLALAIKSPELMVEIAEFMDKKSKENIGVAMREAAEMARELINKGES